MTTPFASNVMPPEASTSEISRSEFQSRLAGLAQAGTAEQKEKKLREACEGFESIFIQKMWEEMRKTLPKSTLLHGREEQFWQGMYDQELAKKMTSVGGIGLADMMYAQLSTNLGNASRTTAMDAANASPRGFVPEVVSMLPTPPAAAGEAPAATSEASAQAQAAQNPSVGSGDSSSGGQGRNIAQGQQHDAGNSAPVGQPASRPEAVRPAPIYEGEAPSVASTENTAVQRSAAQAGRTVAAPDIMNSAMMQSRMAQFEAGSKLGPGAVRPSMRQLAGLGSSREQRNANAQQPVSGIPPLTVQSRGVQAGGTGMNEAVSTSPTETVGVSARMQLGSDVELSPQLRDMAETAVQMSGAIPGGTPQPTTRVRYTTNIPPNGSRTGRKDVIRTLTTDGTGPNSRAGAGIAAYHAQQNGSVAQGSATASQSQSEAASHEPYATPLQAASRQQPAPAVVPSASDAAWYDGPASQGFEMPTVSNGTQNTASSNGAQNTAPQSRQNTNAAASATGIPPLTRRRESRT